MPRCRRLARWLVPLMLVIALTGCEDPWQIDQPPQPPPTSDKPDKPLPNYLDLAARYNVNVMNIDQFWSRAVVTVRFVEQDGKQRTEQGEGHFIFVLPTRVALSVGKVGKTLLWAGSNEKQFWLIDLMNDPTRAYVGTLDEYGFPETEQVPMGIAPPQMLDLLGVTLLPTDPRSASLAHVEWFGERLLVEIPTYGLRMLIDPKTALPHRVDMLDREGNSVLISKLSEHELVQTQGKPKGAWPEVASEVEFMVAGEDGAMRLRLNDMSDGREFNRIKPRAFDFNVLVKAYRPDEVVELE